jgi:hypothetical protein
VDDRQTTDGEHARHRIDVVPDHATDSGRPTLAPGRHVKRAVSFDSAGHREVEQSSCGLAYEALLLESSAEVGGAQFVEGSRRERSDRSMKRLDDTSARHPITLPPARAAFSRVDESCS